MPCALRDDARRCVRAAPAAAATDTAAPSPPPLPARGSTLRLLRRAALSRRAAVRFTRSSPDADPASPDTALPADAPVWRPPGVARPDVDAAAPRDDNPGDSEAPRPASTPLASLTAAFSAAMTSRASSGAASLAADVVLGSASLAGSGAPASCRLKPSACRSRAATCGASDAAGWGVDPAMVPALPGARDDCMMSTLASRLTLAHRLRKASDLGHQFITLLSGTTRANSVAWFAQHAHKRRACECD